MVTKKILKRVLRKRVRKSSAKKQPLVNIVIGDRGVQKVGQAAGGSSSSSSSASSTGGGSVLRDTGSNVLPWFPTLTPPQKSIPTDTILSPDGKSRLPLGITKGSPDDNPSMVLGNSGDAGGGGGSSGVLLNPRQSVNLLPTPRGSDGDLSQGTGSGGGDMGGGGGGGVSSMVSPQGELVEDFKKYLTTLHDSLSDKLNAQQEAQMNHIQSILGNMPSNTTVPSDLAQLVQNQHLALGRLEAGLTAMENRLQANSLEASARMSTLWNQFAKELSMFTEGKTRDVQSKVQEIEELVKRVPVGVATQILPELESKLATMQNTQANGEIKQALATIYNKIEQAVQTSAQQSLDTSAKMSSLWSEFAREVTLAGGSRHQETQAKLDQLQSMLRQVPQTVGENVASELATKIPQVQNNPSAAEVDQVLNDVYNRIISAIDHNKAVQEQTQEMLQKVGEHVETLQQVKSDFKGDMYLDGYDDAAGQDNMTDVAGYRDLGDAVSLPTAPVYLNTDEQSIQSNGSGISSLTNPTYGTEMTHVGSYHSGGSHTSQMRLPIIHEVVHPQSDPHAEAGRALSNMYNSPPTDNVSMNSADMAAVGVLNQMMYAN